MLKIFLQNKQWTTNDKDFLSYMQNFWFYEHHLKPNFSNILQKFCLFEQHLQWNTILQFFDHKQSSVPCTMVNMGLRIFESFTRFWQDFVQESFWSSIIRPSHHLHSFVYILFCLHFVKFVYIFSLRNWKERENSNLIFAYILTKKREGNLNKTTTIETELGLTWV